MLQAAKGKKIGQGLLLTGDPHVVVFFHFWRKFENSKWPPFLGRGNFFWKLTIVHSSYTLWVENFDEIALSRTVKEIQAILCFSILGENSKIQNGRHFWGGENFFWKLTIVHSSYTLWVENFDEIALSRTVKEIEAILCFSIFGENSKWPRFLRRENFLKIANSTFLLYPVGRKFRRNRSISHRFWDKRVFVFSALRKIVTFSKSLISRPFCIGSFRKVIDFQTCI